MEQAVLNDREYVAQLERHYAITKDIIAGRLRPDDARPSPRLTGLKEVLPPVSKPHVTEEARTVQGTSDEPFDLHQFDHDDEDYDEIDHERAEEYANALAERFEASPEAQPLLASDADLSWAPTFLHYSLIYLGQSPPQMSAGNAEEVLFEHIPRKVSVDADQAGEIIAVLRAFWPFLRREFQLDNAERILKLLDSDATERLHDTLDDPANFGMAKSLFMVGKKAGFDMTTELGLAEFMLAYNANRLSQLGANRTPPTASPPRGLGIFSDDPLPTQFASRSERRAAERADLRKKKKQQRQAKRQSRR